MVQRWEKITSFFDSKLTTTYYVRLTKYLVNDFPTKNKRAKFIFTNFLRLFLLLFIF